MFGVEEEAKLGADIRFSYNVGSVAAIDYSANNGSSFTTYYYVRNAQNDIVKLIDGSNNTKVAQLLFAFTGEKLTWRGTASAHIWSKHVPFRR